MTQLPAYHDLFAVAIPPGAGKTRAIRSYLANMPLAAGAELLEARPPVKRQRRIRPPDGPRTRAERGGMAQATAILGLPPRTIQDLAARGELAGAGAAKLGRRWTFDLGKLRQHVKQKERQAWHDAKRPPDVTGAPAFYGAAFACEAANSDGRFTRLTRRLRARATKPPKSD